MLAEHTLVGQPYLCSQHLGFITACDREQIIDLPQHLSCLNGYVTGRIGGDPLQEDKISEGGHATDDGLRTFGV